MSLTVALVPYGFPGRADREGRHDYVIKTVNFQDGWLKPSWPGTAWQLKTKAQYFSLVPVEPWLKEVIKFKTDQDTLWTVTHPFWPNQPFRPSLYKLSTVTRRGEHILGSWASVPFCSQHSSFQLFSLCFLLLHWQLSFRGHFYLHGSAFLPHYLSSSGFVLTFNFLTGREN